MTPAAEPGPPEPSAAPTPRAWTRFRRAHLFDYNEPAITFWCSLACGGLLALLLALVQLSWLPAPTQLQVLGWTLIVALAAAFPVEIPRTKHSIALGDVFIFLLLAQFGTAAAVFAVAVEGCVAVCRVSTRLSSRVISTASPALAMSASGLLVDLSRSLLPPAVADLAGAQLAQLLVAALVYYPVSTAPLMQVVCLKLGRHLRWREWLANSASVGALLVLAALLAGVLTLMQRELGAAVMVAGVSAIGCAATLLRVHFRRQRQELDAQQARVAAAELDAEQNQQRFHAAFTHAAIGMAIVAPAGTILQVNQALCTLLGGTSQQLVGRDFASLMHPDDADLLERHANEVSQQHEESFSIEMRCMGWNQGARTGERETWVSLHCSLFGDASTAHAGLIYQLLDITSRRRAEGDLRHIAYHDSLTNLANRARFHQRLQLAVQRRRDDVTTAFAVMCLDLDRFKVVNDNLGHPAGDHLLAVAAERISASVRPGDLVARLGGDEFAVLFEGQPTRDELMQVGRRLLLALEQPVLIGGTEVRPAASVGLTISDADRDSDSDGTNPDADELLRQADLAMYKAKAEGRGQLALFDRSLTEQLGDKLQLEGDLRRAIAEGQLSLAYQPLYVLEPHRLCGFEALARWTHPVRGPISPAVFIALAEEAGCIEALTRWAVDEAVRQHADWRQATPLHDGLVMHVNVSGKDLAKAGFVDFVHEVLIRHRLPPRLLLLEITESTVMEHREAAMLALAELRDLGVKLGIDDFGTGYSSLAYLSTLPIDCLKIDRSFVLGMQHSAQNVEIVRTVVSLGRSLNKDVVAEGIETPEQLKRLRQLGATIGQGYLLSRPLSAAQAAALQRDLELAPA